jgi:DNA-binding response OmpR family regulator
VIVIVSSLQRERAALSALCESNGWPCTECDSVHRFALLLRHTKPQIAIFRHKLTDGYSDNAIATLADAKMLSGTRVIVLLEAGAPAAIEARQVRLGADCVQRDPARMDVLLEYLAKYRSAKRSTAFSHAAPKPFRFAGGVVDPVDRELRHGKRAARITPREIDLAELLVQSAGKAVTYHTLYGEVLGRKFRGETVNMRVLLLKLIVTARKAGISLRTWVEVIPKLGYRYDAPRARKKPR